MSAHVESLYLAHHGWLQGWLRKKVGNAFDAADLAQSTFLKVLGAKGLDQLQEPRAYLTTLAQRVLYNFWRRRELEQAWLDALATLPGVEKIWPSEANMVLLRVRDAARAQAEMKARGVLVKNVSAMHPLLANCLRLTVGTHEENAQMLAALKESL
ncbi:MAG TPA: RNA polymerase subunit sigma [Delftia acidovorans]|nr:RNA polymerase subunit sigma [Delftia acidovorans]